ncbi:MAG: ABC transporter substrate-binding protein, partial [Bacteroidetes bacterium]|nr:ABC transporter substrate-binding protein [Bacteroidota bacterium]
MTCTVTVWAKAILSISIITCVICTLECTLAWAEGTIKIAAILPQTGKAKAYGRAALEGAHIAVEKINTSG